jgi:hypothetical protein
MDPILTAYGAILGLTITVYIFCTDKLAKWGEKIKKVGQLKDEIERNITQELKGTLEPIFEKQPVVVSPILDGATEKYIETPVNPIKSELFLDTLSEFINGKSKNIGNLYSLRVFFDKWKYFHRMLKRLLIALASYELFCCSIYMLKMINKWVFNNWTSIEFFTPTGFLLVSVLVTLGLLEFIDTKIEDIEKEFYGL